MLLSSFMGCELYEDETYLMNDVEDLVCQRLNDTLSVNTDTEGLLWMGPVWTGSNIQTAFDSEERIGTSWFNDEFVPRTDLYVFINGADTLAAMEIKDMQYDPASETVDSIEISYIYNASGGPAFSGTDTTLIIAGTHDAPVYLDFSQGIVSSSASWHIVFDGMSIGQDENGKVARESGAGLFGFSRAPSTGYLADGPGFGVALEFLLADSVYLEKPDSLNNMKLPNPGEAGYVLLDRTGMSAADIGLNASDYMSIAIWGEDGEALDPVETNISMETIAYCHDVKSKAVYALADMIYLIQFLPHEEMVEGTFRLAIVEED